MCTNNVTFLTLGSCLESGLTMFQGIKRKTKRKTTRRFTINNSTTKTTLRAKNFHKKSSWNCRFVIRVVSFLNNRTLQPQFTTGFQFDIKTSRIRNEVNFK